MQLNFFRQYVSVFKAKQEPSLDHAVFQLANTILSSLPQEFRHLHRALGEHLEQYWKDSQIESKIFISLCLFFCLCSRSFYFPECFVTLHITASMDTTVVEPKVSLREMSFINLKLTKVS